MNLSEQLKGKLPFPFETVAVAINFSPRYKSVIREAARVAYLYNSKLVLIHIGRLNAEQKQKISEIESKYKAKIAERKIFLEKSVHDAIAKGSMEEAEEARNLLAQELLNLEAKAESEKEKVRND